MPIGQKFFHVVVDADLWHGFVDCTVSVDTAIALIRKSFRIVVLLNFPGYLRFIFLKNLLHDRAHNTG